MPKLPRKWQGQPLKVNGQPTKTDDPNCCCGGRCLCDCLYLQNKWDNVQGLNADITYPSGCGTDITISLAHSGAPSGIIPPFYNDCPQWGAIETNFAFGTMAFGVWCTGDVLYIVIQQQTLLAAPCTFAEEFDPVLPISLTCDDTSLEAIFNLSVMDNPDPAVLIDCACPSTTLTIRIY